MLGPHKSVSVILSLGLVAYIQYKGQKEAYIPPLCYFCYLLLLWRVAPLPCHPGLVPASYGLKPLQTGSQTKFFPFNFGCWMFCLCNESKVTNPSLLTSSKGSAWVVLAQEMVAVCQDPRRGPHLLFPFLVFQWMLKVEGWSCRIKTRSHDALRHSQHP